VISVAGVEARSPAAWQLRGPRSTRKLSAPALAVGAEKLVAVRAHCSASSAQLGERDDMELDRILLLLAVASCLFLLGRLGRNRFAGARGWAAVCIVLVALAGVGYWAFPDQVGWIVGALWLILLMVPLWLARLVMRRIMQQRFGAARFYAEIVRILHPADGMQTTPVVVEALDAAHRGDPQRAVALLTPLTDQNRMPAAMVLVVRAQIARVLGDWRAVAALAESAAPGGRSAFGMMRVRAYGETGRLHQLIAEVLAARQTTDIDYQLALMCLFAFCGRRAAVAELLDGPLAAFDQDTRTFWLATAALVRGSADAAAELAALAGCDRPISRAARQRLDVPLAGPDRLEPEDVQIVDEAEAAMRREAGYRGVPSAEWRRSYVVFGLIVLNAAGFAAELIAGGSESTRALYRLGALWPDSVLDDGEWWRLGAALFLHVGPVHLALNMLALVVVGPWLERAIGHWRFALLYLGSGLGSMAAVLVLMRAGGVAPGLLVGASGAILGLVGAEVALLVRGWRGRKSRLAARRLLAMMVIIALQIVFDLTTPQVSFAAHASGFVVGACLVGLLALISRRSQAK
jgi:rhomboid protease GluP